MDGAVFSPFPWVPEDERLMRAVVGDSVFEWAKATHSKLMQANIIRKHPTSVRGQ
jgi:hypothetical protein